MKQFRFRILMSATVLAALLLLVSGLVAQGVELPETFTFASGTTFNYPAGSRVEIDSVDAAVAHLQFNGSDTVTVIDSPATAAAGFDASSDLVDALAWYLGSQYAGAVTFEAEVVEMADAPGREIAQYVYERPDGGNAVLVAIRLRDGSIGLIDASATDENESDQIELVLAIAMSFDSLAEAEPGAGTPCLVSTANVNSVQLRVGPGTNRTVFAFLLAGRSFVPQGQAKAQDDSLWFRLDKAEVAPKAAVTEAWVAAADVQAVGDCASVGAASAPPIIPIVPAAPPAARNPNSSDPDASAGMNGDAVSPSVSPAEGWWTVRFAATGKASCLDLETVDFYTQIPSYVAELTVVRGGILFDRNLLTEVQPGVYSGNIEFSDGSSVRVVLWPAGPTLFTGEATANVTIQGHQCSATVPITVSKN